MSGVKRGELKSMSSSRSSRLKTLSDKQFNLLKNEHVPQNQMGRSEKIMIMGFVAATASVSYFAHYYTMQEGYAMKARKQLEKSNNSTEPKNDPTTQKAPTVGGVWGNITKMRDNQKN